MPESIRPNGLVREMAHRAGNMLQLVNSIASQTFSSDADTQIARKPFSERLSTLARSNYIMSRGGWKSTRFAELVQEALEPFQSRVSTEGRDILLPPDLCFDMGLVLHELATNSVKYGTLGKDAGLISVKWYSRPRSYGSHVFCFDWDDPLATYQSSSNGTGFGTKLMKSMIERKWHGIVTVGVDSHFKTRFEIPLSGISANETNLD